MGKTDHTKSYIYRIGGLMLKEDKRNLSAGNTLYCIAIRSIRGFHNLFDHKRYFYLFILYLLIFVTVNIFYRRMHYFDYLMNYSEYETQLGLINNLLLLGFLLMIYMIGAPARSWHINRQLQRIGLCNSAGDSPYYIDCTRNPINDSYTLKFITFGIPVSEFEKKREALEAALNMTITSIVQGSTRRNVLVTAVPYNNSLSKIYQWSDSFISSKDGELVLGISLLGQYCVNLNNQPHILIGGETGSGKSVLLKSLLWQCIQKDADVYIADFKGGIDFTSLFEQHAHLIVDSRTELLNQLNDLVAELERRKTVLKIAGASSVTEYNETHFPLKRIIFACDEVAELLDKTGLSKEDKTLVGEIEGCINTIARLGRALNINLLLATQRPSADIMHGQLKNNLSLRCAGRCDMVLSQIILDNTDAATMIPSTERGLFLTNNGLLFRGYYFDDSTIEG